MYAFLKVMTTNPECGTVDMPILDALHTMHDGKFLHLPVVDRGPISLQYSFFFSVSTVLFNSSYFLNCHNFFFLVLDGNIVTVLDVIHITHAAVATVGFLLL